MQLQLHYITLHYTNYITLHYSYNCTTPRYIQQLWWGDHCNHCNHCKKTQLHPPVGPSVDSPCHPWVATTNLSYRFPIFEISATALCGSTGMEHGPFIDVLCWFTVINLLQHVMFQFAVLYHQIHQNVNPTKSPKKPIKSTKFTVSKSL